MDVRKILKLTWFLVLFFVSGCFYLPKFEEQPQQVNLKLPKLKKIKEEPQKMKLPKLKKV